MKVFFTLIYLLLSTCCIGQNETAKSREISASFGGLSLKLDLPNEVIIKRHKAPKILGDSFYLDHWDIGDTTYSLFSISIDITKLPKTTIFDKNYLDSLRIIQDKEDSAKSHLFNRTHTDSNELTKINNYVTVKSVGWTASGFIYYFVSYRFIEKNKLITIYYSYADSSEKKAKPIIQKNIMTLKIE